MTLADNGQAAIDRRPGRRQLDVVLMDADAAEIRTATRLLGGLPRICR